jgi:uncharacterized membrane protein YeaQ/YmgE (transglycosylase-associated protein family)
VGRLLGFVGATVGGWAGWALGSPFGMFAAFFASIVGTALGVYAANRLTRHWLG